MTTWTRYTHAPLLSGLLFLGHCGGSAHSRDDSSPTIDRNGSTTDAAHRPDVGSADPKGDGGTGKPDASCGNDTETECGRAPGSECTRDAQCLTSLCVDGRCCTESCGICEQCTGKNGSCAPMAPREPDERSENACTGDHWCDGLGDCKPRAQVTAGTYRTCAVSSEGKVRCWGGLQGPTIIGDDEAPNSRDYVSIGGDVLSVVSGFSHTCALLVGGTVRCWGSGGSWLGYGLMGTDVLDPSEVGDVPIGGKVVRIAAGRYHTCALLSNGRLRCWGEDGRRLGYATSFSVGYDNVPADAGDVDVGELVADVAAGWRHTCALLIDGNVRCWGGVGLEMGGSDPDAETPALAGNVTFVDGDAIQVTAGVDHTCVLLADGTVRCSGQNHQGQIGYPGTSSDIPESNVEVGGTVEEIAAGEYHTCARLSSGSVRCWGLGEDGQLGYGNTENIGDDETPASAGDIELGGVAIGIAAGGAHTCALLEGLEIRCWGSADAGQLGYGNTENIGDDETPASAGDVAYR